MHIICIKFVMSWQQHIIALSDYYSVIARKYDVIGQYGETFLFSVVWCHTIKCGTHKLTLTNRYVHCIEFVSRWISCELEMTQRAHFYWSYAWLVPYVLLLWNNPSPSPKPILLRWHFWILSRHRDDWKSCWKIIYLIGYIIRLMMSRCRNAILLGKWAPFNIYLGPTISA